MSSDGLPARRSRLSRAARLALVLGLLLSLVGAWVSLSLQRSQERELLRGRAAEVGLILTQAINNIPDRLKAQGAVLEATGLQTTAYVRAASSDVTANAGRASFAWLRPRADGSFVVLAAAGEALRQGEVVAGLRAEPMVAALTNADLVPGSVLGEQRALGFAQGPPAAPAGTVLYQENRLGPRVSPPRQADSAPFAELAVALYGTPTEDSAQVLVGTTPDLPLRGRVVRSTLPVGTGSWLLAVEAEGPLSGRLASLAPAFALAAGLVLSGLVAAVVETAERRRREALERLRTERRSSELFQRSLLPRLPSVPGLDVAARYLPSERGQEVGGDWFDVFPLPRGGVGVVIGDVMGHDLLAASGMAQVRSALRAYARYERDPAVVLDQLDALVSALEITELVTVFYGTITEPAADGSRVLRWSNAGHLPPLLRAEGSVVVLDDAGSLVIGTPLEIIRASSEVAIPSGSTLVLFTDGLVEVAGASLDGAVERLAAALARSSASTADGLCEVALSTLVPQERRDDIALLTVTNLAVPAVGAPRDTSVEPADRAPTT